MPPSETSPIPVAPRPWRALMWLYVAAAVLGPLSVLVPHVPATQDGPLLAVCALALLVAAGVAMAGARTGHRALHALLALGTVLVTAAIEFTDGAPNAAALLYLWVALFAAYYFGGRALAAHLALVGLGYAINIALRPPDVPIVAHWLTTIGSLAGAGVFVAVLKARLDVTIARLEQSARHDHLTGLLNRRGLHDAIEAERRRALRTGRPFALVIGDLDHFGTLNERLGSVAGDEALRRFAAVLGDHGRDIDVAGRLGGEEFAVVLPETEPTQAVLAAERLRLVVGAVLAQAGTPLTVSFGIACHPAHAAGAEGLTHCAGRALQAAKHAGRNTVVLYEPGATERALADAERAGGDGRLGAILLLAESLDLRDPSTAAHSRTVAELATAMARRLGLSEPQVERIRLASVLHDVGKIAVPDAILHKPAALTDDEWTTMRRHPEIGARLLEGAGLGDLARWVHLHHERPDGRGYPLALDAGEIPLEARILAVADAYEAMVSDRPYRRGMPVHEAIAELRRCVGAQFDTIVVDAFIALVADEGLRPRCRTAAGARR